MIRSALLVSLLLILALIVTFFRRLGLGEVALIAAVLALAFIVEIGRYLIKQFLRGYRR